MYIAIDIGGTTTRVMGSRDFQAFTDPVLYNTPTDPEQRFSKLVETIDQVAEGQPTAVAVGVAGPVDADGRTGKTPHLAGWENYPLGEKLSTEIAVPVYVKNDTALVGLGEATKGAGQGHKIVVYITVSTGVGGARIIKGEIDETVHGYEPGHHIIDTNDGPDGGPIYAEDYLSGTAMEKKHGSKPQDITDRGVWDDWEEKLAMFLNNITVTMDPEIIVLGGGLIVKNTNTNFDHVVERFGHYERIFEKAPVLKKAQLGDLGGAWGGFELLKQKAGTQ